MNRDEVARIKRRIEKAERRLARGVDVRHEARGPVSESEIRARLLKKLESIQQEEAK